MIAKGIQTYDDLQKALEKGFLLDEVLLLSTDIRALFNPSREACAKNFKTLSRLSNARIWEGKRGGCLAL